MVSQLEIIQRASLLIERKRYTEAKDILLKYLESSKNIKKDIKFYFTLYLVFDGLKETKIAKKYLEKCLKINDKNYIVLNNLANIYLKEGDTNKAEKFYLKSYNLKKDYLLVIVNLAIFYTNIGDLNNSKKFYLKAIELNPKRISIYYNLSRIDKSFINNEKINLITKLMNEKQEFAEMSYGYFMLAEHERKKKNFSLEISYLDKANYFSNESMKEANKKTLNYWSNIITNKYDNFDFLNYNKNNELGNYKPIFIVGLPRSGSTVTEVLLSSAKKKIVSLGESSLINGIIAKDFSDDHMSEINLEIVENKILKIFDNMNFDKKNYFFIDKSLENFFYIEIILKIFPHAIFINTTRNLKDNIIAIYKSSLSKLSWTHSIKDILLYIDNYIKIIKYFEKKYPKKILTINLEELTNNLNDVTKELYSFCNLEWSKNVVNPQNRKDLFISTASNIQIRGSIEKYDSKKYEPYKDLIKNYLDIYKWLN